MPVSTPTATAQSCVMTGCGSAVLSLTDAAGDFLSYKVGLASLTLKRADGTLVETLPATAMVDLVQLVNLSEIISAKQIPTGEYVAAQVTVDFSTASILVDDGTGAGVTVQPIDATGAALGQMRLTVQFDAHHDLSIGAGIASRVALDFNLLASNTVDLAAKTVTVNPVLIASTAALDNKDLRVRGSLGSVDTAASDYTLEVRPFDEHSSDKRDTIIVHTTATTTFEINGTPSAGGAGLAELAALPAGTTTVAFGSLQSDQAFAATRVLAGTSVEGPGIDHLLGDVIARSGNTLTVHGAHVEHHDGGDAFVGGGATVTIADATAVTVEGQAEAAPVHTIAEISVGSRIEVFGTVATDASQHVTVDATAGRVRLDFKRIHGLLTSLGSTGITLNVSAIPAQDSNPANYAVATGKLDLGAFSAGERILGIGLVGAFGGAPPDFTAVTVANSIAAVGMPGDNGEMTLEESAELEVDWGNSGTTAPFKAVDAVHLDLDIANPQIGEHHLIEVEPQMIDLKALSSDPSIVPGTSSGTLFAIAHDRSKSIENFNGFADFEAKLASSLNGTVTAVGLSAKGKYDGASIRFSAVHLIVKLND